MWETEKTLGSRAAAAHELVASMVAFGDFVAWTI